MYECMAIDLHRILSRLVKPLWQSQIKSIMLMLLQAVEQCHASNIVHRVSLSLNAGREAF